MNTLNELLSLGIDEVNANRMIDSYKLKIGTDNGDFKITDITYLGKETREVELTCQSCGMVIHKSFVNRRNKWSELQKNCMCKKQSKDPEKKRLYNNDIRYIGETYNGFQVIDFKLVPHKNKSGNTVKWICKCIICGEIKEYLPNDIKSGNKKCICQQETITYPRMKYIGLKFNRLTIIDFDRNVDKANHVYAVCKCECGNDYKSQLQFVIDGTVKSCGCYREDHKYDRKKDFRVVDSPLYATWSCMKQRCFNKKSSSYDNYGGRGITVCDEWKNDFLTFEKWCFDNGYRPNSGLSIDRIDPNGNYCPENCRFANVYVQCVNQRPKTFKKNLIEINGVSKTRKDWLKEYNIYDATVRYREKYMNMTFEEALTAEKQTIGNHYASLNLPESKKEELVNLNKCKSYIETNLYMAFIRKKTDVRLLPQFKIGKYTVDFLVEETNYVVECDGYDYHKSKEQIQIDYERERFLQLNGYVVIRFTGSEINNNPDKCAEEIINLVNNRNAI